MSQELEILMELKRGNKITPLDALEKFGVFRLGARILELRRQGYPVITEMKKLNNGKRIAEYRMEL